MAKPGQLLGVLWLPIPGTIAAASAAGGGGSKGDSGVDVRWREQRGWGMAACWPPPPPPALCCNPRKYRTICLYLTKSWVTWKKA